MAKVRRNIFMRGLSGTIGDQVVLKTIRGGRTIVCKKPTFQEDREFSQAQLAHQQAFREARPHLEIDEFHGRIGIGSSVKPFISLIEALSDLLLRQPG